MFGFTKRTMTSEEYTEWLEGFEADNYKQEKRKEFEQKYGDNRMDKLDIDETLQTLKNEHYQGFMSGANFPPQYKHILDAHNREGYEIARYGSVMNCRIAMLLDYTSFTTDHYKTTRDQYGEIQSHRQLSRVGVNVLAICQAWDAAQEMKRKKNNAFVVDYREAKDKHRKKIFDLEPIVVNGCAADLKKADKQLAMADFKAQFSDEPDFIDNIGKGFKKFFGF